MQFRLDFTFVCFLSFFGTSLLVSDSFFPQESFSRSHPNPFLSTRWRNVFPNEKSLDESLLRPVLKNTQNEHLLRSDFNYPTLFPEIFNDTDLFRNIFLNDGSIQKNIDLFDVLIKKDRDDKKPENGDVTDEDAKAKHEDNEEITYKEDETTEIGKVATVKNEGNVRNDDGIVMEDVTVGVEETEEKEKRYKSSGKSDIDIVVTVKYEENGDEIETKEISTMKQEEDKINTDEEEIKETQIKERFENVSLVEDEFRDKQESFNVGTKEEDATEKTSWKSKVDEVESISNEVKTEEVTTMKTNWEDAIERGKTNESDRKTDAVDTKIEKETKNESENGKTNPKTEMGDKEENSDKKRIMSVENNEEQSESKKGKTNEEETNHKVEKETDEENISNRELNEIKNEDTKVNNELLKIAYRESENNRNESTFPQAEKENNIAETERKPKVEETLRETLPDELSNSDLDVLQDNSTNFICLTDSKRCLSKSTSILLTTGILIGIIVGLVTIVGISTGISVYIFHRWKLRKKSPGRSNQRAAKTFISTLRPPKKRPTKQKPKQRDAEEENDSPVNTLEAITVHNYTEDRRHVHNL